MSHPSHIFTRYLAGVTAFLNPSVAGFLLQKELDYLQGAVDEPKRPFAAIVGGSKVYHTPFRYKTLCLCVTFRDIVD